MKIHKFGNKQNTKGQIYRCKKLNQDICYTFLIIHDLKCPRICGHTVLFMQSPIEIQQDIMQYSDSALICCQLLEIILA